MSYKNYLAISKTSAEKFEGFDNDAQDKTSTFNDAGVPYAEFVVSKGRNVAKPIHTFDPTAKLPTDVDAIKAFQDQFLTANNNEFTDYPTKEIGNYYSADIINMARRMLNPTENLFTIPVPADWKEKFIEIFSNSVVGTPKKYATVNQFRFELNFDDSPSSEQVLQLRTFMTLMESEYSTMTGTKVTTGSIIINKKEVDGKEVFDSRTFSVEDIAREFGPDMATLYDFAFEYTEKTFNSKVMLSEEVPNVDGPIVNSYLHARQGVAMDQPLKPDLFFTKAMDGRIIQNDFLGVLDVPFYSSYLQEVQSDKATLTYEHFEKALGLNKKSMGQVASYAWDLDKEEIQDIQETLADFNNAIYVEFALPINNADGTNVAQVKIKSLYEPVSGFKNTVVKATPVEGTVQDDQAKAQLASMQSTAEERFNQYLKARGF